MPKSLAGLEGGPVRGTPTSLVAPFSAEGTAVAGNHAWTMASPEGSSPAMQPGGWSQGSSSGSVPGRPQDLTSSHVIKAAAPGSVHGSRHSETTKSS